MNYPLGTSDRCSLFRLNLQSIHTVPRDRCLPIAGLVTSDDNTAPASVLGQTLDVEESTRPDLPNASKRRGL